MKNLKYWLTTDWHLNHARIIEYENRPENFKELIINNWLKVVQPNDIVINLGDVIFSRAKELYDILPQLPGKKIMVTGNHDRQTSSWYRRAGFDYVCNLYEYKNIIFTHKPVDLNEYPNKNITMNIHGHFHTKDDSAYGYHFYSKNHKCVSIEKLNYELIELYDFINS